MFFRIRDSQFVYSFTCEAKIGNVLIVSKHCLIIFIVKLAKDVFFFFLTFAFGFYGRDVMIHFTFTKILITLSPLQILFSSVLLELQMWVSQDRCCHHVQWNKTVQDHNVTQSYL